jgi:predicted oxidoreductase
VFLESVLAGEADGLVSFALRHRVDEVIVEDGTVRGVRGAVRC